MKTKTKIILFLSVLALCSCSLKETPYGFYSEDNFYKTAADASAAVDYAYATMTFLEYSRGIFYLGEMPTENISPKSDEGQDATDLDRWNVKSFSTSSLLQNYFSYAFIGVNRANAVIQNVPKGDYDQELKNQYTGEGYFLRAWNYFNLVRMFGLVPIHTTTVESLNQTSSPLASDIGEVYDLIISDCRKAASLMPVYGTPKTGRADRVAAQALASKAYLFMASAKEHNVPLYKDLSQNTDALYDSAAYYAGKVINEQTTYHFDSSLLDIYDVDNPIGPEHIFIMSMDRTGTVEGQYSKISKMFIPYVDGGTLYLDNYNGTYSPTHDGWSVYQTTSAFYNSFDAADKRKTQLIVDKVYDATGSVTASYPGKLLYPFTRKYIDPHFIGDKTSTKPYLIRFSDVALIYAGSRWAYGQSVRVGKLYTVKSRIGNVDVRYEYNRFS